MIELDNILMDEHQERMCRLCERNIICGSSNTYHYQCEGRHCEDALELLKEELNEEKQEEYQYLLIR
jgi:hypothetical protein